MSHSQDYLRYGDQITFKYSSEFLHQIKEDLLGKKEEQGRGYITGTGFLDKNLYLQTSGEGGPNEEDIANHQDLMPHTTNFRDFVFVITPRLNFEFHKDYAKTLKNYQVFLKQLLLHKEVSQTKQDLKKKYENKLESLKDRVLKEKELNQQIIENNKGKAFLNYGNEIQIMHKDSGFFVSATKECSQTRKLGYGIELSSWYSKLMVFRLVPKYKSINKGDLIRAKDSIFIENVHYKCFLNFIDVNEPYFNDLGDTIDPRKIYKHNTSGNQGNLYMRDQKKITTADGEGQGDHQMYGDNGLVQTEEDQDQTIDNKGEHSAQISNRSALPSYTQNKHGVIEKMVPITAPNDEQLENIFRVYKTIIDPTCSRYSLFLSHSKNCPWNIGLHISILEKQVETVYGHDLILIQHTETKAFIGADIAMTIDYPEIYAKHYNSETIEEENKSLACLWEIEQLRLDRRGAPFVFKQSKNMSSKMKYKATVQFRLKHFLTGRYMSKQIVNKINMLQLSSIKDQQNPASYLPLRFEPLVVSNENLQYGFCYYIRDQDSYVKNKQKHTLTKDILLSRFFRYEQQRGFVPLKDDNSDGAKSVMHIDKNFSMQDAYLVKPLDEQKERDIMFVRSGVPILNRVVCNLKLGIKPTYQDYTEVQELITNCSYFLFDKIKLLGDEILQFTGDANSLKQMYFREFGYIELVTDILFVGFRRNIFSYSQIYQDEYLMKTLRFCYRFFGFIIRNNRQNEMHASQWIQPIIYQQIQTNKINDIYCSPTLVELLDNNKKILEERINQDLIRNYVNSFMDQEKSSGYLEVLCVMCTCDQIPILKNQIAITETILGNKTVFDKLMVQIRLGSTVEIFETSSQKWIDLREFQNTEIEENEEKLNTKEYFQTLVKLFAKICSNRNTMAINKLKELFSFEMCFKIITDTAICPEIRTSFLLLIKDIWVDINPYSEIRIPTNIVIWKSISESAVFPKTTYSIQNYEQLVKFVLVQLKEFDPHEILLKPSVLGLLLNLIQISKLFLTLGFLTIEQSRELIKCLKGLVFVKLLSAKFLDIKEIDLDQVSLIRRISIQIFKLLLTYESNIKTKLLFEKIKNLQQETEEKSEEVPYRVQDGESTPINRKTNPIKLNKVQDINSIITDEQNNDHDELEYENSQFQQAKNLISDMITNIVEDQSLLEFDKTGTFKFLLKMINSIDDFELKTEVLDLIRQMHTQRVSLKMNIQKIYCITEENLPNYKKMEDIRVRLHNISVDFKNLMDSVELEGLKQNLNDISVQMIRINDLQMDDLTRNNENSIPFSNIITSGPVLNERTEHSFTDSSLEEDSDLKNLKLLGQVATIQKAETNNYSQGLFRAMYIFQDLIRILEYDFGSQLESSQARNEAVQQIYQTLTYAAVNNTQNKSYFTQLLVKTVLGQLQQLEELNVESFVHELCQNNKEFLVQNETVRNFIDALVEKANKLQHSDIRKSQVLQTLGSFVQYKEMLLKHNQDKIIKSIFYSQKSKNFKENFLSKDFEKRMTEESRSIMRKHDNISGHYYLFFSNEMTYTISFIELLNNCGKGQNNLAENISQNLIPVGYMYNLLQIPDANILLKFRLVTFFYNNYIQIEKQSQVSDRMKFIEIAVLLVDELQKCILIYSNKDASKFYVQKKRGESSVISDSMKLSNTSYFVGNHILLCKHVIIEYLSVLSNVFIDLIPTTLEYKHYSKGKVLEMFAKLSEIRSDFSFMEESEIAVKLAFLKEIYETSSKKYISKNVSTNEDPQSKLDNNTDFEKTLEKSEVEEGNQAGRNKNFKRREVRSVTNLMSRLVGQSTQRMDKFSIQSEKKVADLQRFIEKIFRNKSYQLSVELEFEEWIQNIQKIEKENPGKYKRFELLTDFFSNLVHYFHSSSYKIDEKLTLTGLQIFTRFIERATGSTHQKCEDWDSEIWTQYKEKIFYRQNMLVTTGVINWIFKILEDPEINSNVRDKTIELAIAMNIGGNTNVQLEFHKHFIKDKDNLVLWNIYDQIRQCFEVISLTMSMSNKRRLDQMLKATKTSRGSYAKLDSRLVIRSDIKNIENEFERFSRYFRFLQLLCEGHNLKLQNLLREQKSLRKGKISINFREINFVRYASNLFSQYIKFFNQKCCGIGNDLLQFIIEINQGPCVENQNMLYESRIIDHIRNIFTDLHLQDAMYKEMFSEEPDSLNEFLQSLTLLLNTFFEGEQSNTIKRYMAEILDIEFLFKKLRQSYETILKNNQTSESQNEATILQNIKSKPLWPEDVINSFPLFFLIKIFTNIDSKWKDSIETLDEETLKAYQFFEQNSGHVEIVFQGQIERMYFIIHPCCQHLGTGLKDKLYDELSCYESTQRLTEFISKVPTFFDFIDHTAKLKTQNIIFNQTFLKSVRFISVLDSLTMVVLMILFFGKKVVNNDGITNPEFDENHISITILIWAYIGLMSICILLWLVIEAPISIMDKLNKSFRKIKLKLETEQMKKKAYLLNQQQSRLKTTDSKILTMATSLLKNKTKKIKGKSQEQKAKQVSSQDIDHILHLLKRNVAKLSVDERIEVLETYPYRAHKSKFVSKLEYYTRIFIYIIGDSQFKVMFRYLILASIVKYYQKDGFLFPFSLLILDIASFSELMNNVFKAVTYNLRALVMTTLITCIIVYNYALFAYLFLDDTFFNTSTAGGENLCVDMIQCFITIVTLGPRSSGSIGDVILRQSYRYENQDKWWLRYVFDLSIFVVVNIIFMNMVFGVIIDSFGELRGKLNEIEFNRKNVCFICSLDRFTFAEKKLNFDHHIENEHNVWHYLYFIYYLLSKSTTEFTGPESYVYNEIVKNNIKWIPVMRCLELDDEENENQELERNVGSMISNLKLINTQIRGGAAANTEE